jgi:hypothetical protein
MLYRIIIFTILAVALFLTALTTPANAVTFSLVPSNTSVARGGTLTLNINIDNATGVAACTFKLVYPEAVFDLATTPVTTTFFKSFSDNRPGADPAQTHPWEKNAETAGKIMLSGAYIDPNTGGAKYSGNQTLFTINLRVKYDAPLGAFEFKLEQTDLLNPNAGWFSDTNGNNIYEPGEDDLVLAPVLMGAVTKTQQDWNDTSKAFPVLLGDQANPFTPITETVSPGIHPCTDSDNDGLCNAQETNTGLYVDINDTGTDPNNPDTDSDGMADGWEVTYELDPLDDQDANEDDDQDGYANLEEYERGTDPTDPNSHPTETMPWIPLLLFGD